MTVGTCSGSNINLDGTIFHKKIIHDNCTGYTGLSNEVHRVKINIDGIGDIIVHCDLTTSPHLMMVVPRDADGTQSLR